MCDKVCVCVWIIVAYELMSDLTHVCLGVCLCLCLCLWSCALVCLHLISPMFLCVCVCVCGHVH